MFMMASISTFAYKPANLIGTWEVRGEDTYPYIITFTIKEGGWGLYHFYNQYNNGDPLTAEYRMNYDRDILTVYKQASSNVLGVIIEESPGKFFWYKSFKDYEWGKKGFPVKKLNNTPDMDYGFRR